MILLHKNKSLNVDHIVTIENKRDNVLNRTDVTIVDVNGSSFEFTHDLSPNIGTAILNRIINCSERKMTINVDILSKYHIKKVLEGVSDFNKNLTDRLSNIRHAVEKKRIEIEKKLEAWRIDPGDKFPPIPDTTPCRIAENQGFPVSLISGVTELFSISYNYRDGEVKCYVNIPYNNIEGYVSIDTEKEGLEHLEDIYKYLTS